MPANFANPTIPLSEQVRELEAERDALRVDFADLSRHLRRVGQERDAANEALAAARAEGAREAFVEGDLHGRRAILADNQFCRTHETYSAVAAEAAVRYPSPVASEGARTCKCGHAMEAHIYHEGACRRGGDPCPCEEYREAKMHGPFCDVGCACGMSGTPSPEPERVTIPVESKVYGSPDSWDAFASVRVTITPELARRIFEMAFPRGVGTGSSAGGRSSLAAQDGGRDA